MLSANAEPNALRRSQVSERTEDYLIKWEGVDNDGEPHKPTWVSLAVFCSFSNATGTFRKQTALIHLGSHCAQEKKHKVTPDLIEEWRNGGRRQWKRDKKEKKRLSKLEKAKAKAAAAVQGPSTSKKGAPGRKTRAGLMDAPAPSVKPKVRLPGLLGDPSTLGSPFPLTVPQAPSSLRFR